MNPEPMDGDSQQPGDSLAAEHALLDGLLLRSTAGKAAMECRGDAAIRLIRAAILRLEHKSPDASDREKVERVFLQLIQHLLGKKLQFSAADLRTLLIWIQHCDHFMSPRVAVARTCARFLESEDPRGIEADLQAAYADLHRHAAWDSGLRKYVAQIGAKLGTVAQLPIVGGEPWADAIIDALGKTDATLCAGWSGLLIHCTAATSAKPSAKWSQKARRLVETLGEAEVATKLAQWLPLFDLPRGPPSEAGYREDLDGWSPIHRNQDTLRGLVWLVPILAHADLTEVLQDMALSGYKKLPEVGARAVKVGNAAVYSLGQIDSDAAIAALAVLKVRLKSGPAKKSLEKALMELAERMGIPPEDIEEIGVPTFGMQKVGLRTEKLGDFRVELALVGGNKGLLRWFRPDGKAQKSIPKAVKEDHADGLKALRKAARDMEKMARAQKERIDNLFLSQKRWAGPVFKERYLDHPLVGTLARRLIWNVESGATTTAVLWQDGALRTRQGTEVGLADGTEVSLWHPMQAPEAEVLAWRAWLEEREVTQPFKQAHREVYLLTDAERSTNTYSNRFAAHIVKQHQFNALCAARDWKASLQLMVDDSFPMPTRRLPAWNLRAEFWVEGAGDEDGVDTNDAGTFLYLATDQVRFYAWDPATTGDGGPQAPIPLEDIPAVVLSEILRDIDLFVGVASVGNDPTWSDGGTDGRHRDYWQSFSFGALSETAMTRKVALERLVPRLKIRDVCEVQGRFLVVRGKLRTYKIHLGSSNILMEPNDQYLCIVSPRTAPARDALFLPFEGDTRMSTILSKALMLAADDRITDPTIVSQIKT